MLTNVYNDVGIVPRLLPFTVKNLENQTANRSNEARVDI